MATVAQLLGRKPRAIYSVAADAPVLEAIRLMAEHSIGALLVMQRRHLGRDRLGARLRAQGDSEGPLVERHASPADHDRRGDHGRSRLQRRSNACTS